MSKKALNYKVYDVIRFPYVTEKSTAHSEQSKVVFLVDSASTKGSIKESVEGIFNVKVQSVNTLNKKGKNKVFRGRAGTQSGFKKAIVTLMPGQNIDITTGI